MTWEKLGSSYLKTQMEKWDHPVDLPVLLFRPCCGGRRWGSVSRSAWGCFRWSVGGGRWRLRPQFSCVFWSGHKPGRRSPSHWAPERRKPQPTWKLWIWSSLLDETCSTQRWTDTELVGTQSVAPSQTRRGSTAQLWTPPLKGFGKI